MSCIVDLQVVPALGGLRFEPPDPLPLPGSRSLPPQTSRYHEIERPQAGAPMAEDPSIFISAGEASGEAYGAMLLHALSRRLAGLHRGARFFGMGGRRMAEAGLEQVVGAEEMAVMGITEVVAHLPRIYRGFRRLRSAIATRRPKLAILIDFPDVHLRLAADLKRFGVPVLYFVSPQLWAWKKGRIRRVRRYVDRMLVIFPFEEEFYRSRGV